MLFWLAAITITAIACIALYVASAGRTVNSSQAETAPSFAHYRGQLAEIDADLASGKLPEDQAVAARAELAREVMRLKGQAAAVPAGARGPGQAVFGLATLGVAVLALGVYWSTGMPDAPAQPLAGRALASEQQLVLDDVVASIEQQLVLTPEDIEGWRVIGPAYMSLGRPADAETAYRQAIALGGDTPEIRVDLAETMIVQREGDASGEPLELLQSAVADNPSDLRARYYIANELTRAADYPAAATQWSELIALAEGTEPWLETARQGLAFAQSGGDVEATASAQDEMIRGMVETLDSRLAEEGGTIEEWTRLVEARLVLGDEAAAQAAFDRAVAAYPRSFDREGLDAIALNAGLQLNGGTP